MDILGFHSRKIFSRLTQANLNSCHQLPSQCLETRIGEWRGNMSRDELEGIEMKST